MRNRRHTWLAVPAAALLVAAACGDDDGDGDEPTDTGAEPGGTEVSDDADADGETEADGEAASLAGICPNPIVVQTDWFPQSEHGFVYELLGDDVEINGTDMITRGPLVSGGADTGVDLEIRAGGPAIGDESPTTQLYQDDDILFGFVYTDEAIQNSDQFPTVAVFAGMEKNPQIIMWDPETYPDVETIDDLGEQGVEVLYFSGGAYMDYFTQSGILSPDQVDGSYDGSPTRFTAEEGAVAQQGFGSAEPFKYEHEFDNWAKPVAYQYINDAGWENYAESFATRPENIEEHRECFEAFVPMLQQSTIDFLADPAATNELIREIVEEYDSWWTYSPEVAEYAVETIISDGLHANGPDGVLGSFDADRVEGLIEVARPIYESQGQAPPDDLAAEDLFTNEFLDDSIGL